MGERLTRGAFHRVLACFVECIAAAAPEAALVFLQHLPGTVKERCLIKLCASQSMLAPRLLGVVTADGKLFPSAADGVWTEQTRLERATVTAVVASQLAAHEQPALAATVVDLWAVTVVLCKDSGDLSRAAMAANEVCRFAVSFYSTTPTQAAESAAERFVSHIGSLRQAASDGGLMSLAAKLSGAVLAQSHAAAQRLMPACEAAVHGRLVPLEHRNIHPILNEWQSTVPEGRSVLLSALRAVIIALLHLFVQSNVAQSAPQYAAFREAAHCIIQFEAALGAEAHKRAECAAAVRLAAREFGLPSPELG